MEQTRMPKGFYTRIRFEKGGLALLRHVPEDTSSGSVVASGDAVIRTIDIIEVRDEEEHEGRPTPGECSVCNDAKGQCIQLRHRFVCLDCLASPTLRQEGGSFRIREEMEPADPVRGQCVSCMKEDTALYCLAPMIKGMLAASLKFPIWACGDCCAKNPTMKKTAVGTWIPKG